MATKGQPVYTKKQWEKIEGCLVLDAVEQLDESAALLTLRWWRPEILAAVTAYSPGRHSDQRAWTGADQRDIVEDFSKYGKRCLKSIERAITAGYIDAEHPRVKEYKNLTQTILDELRNPGLWAEESWHRAIERRIAEDSVDTDDLRTRINKYREQRSLSDRGSQGLKRGPGRPRGISKDPEWLFLIHRLLWVFDYFNHQSDNKRVSRFLRACLEPRFKSLRRDYPNLSLPSLTADNLQKTANRLRKSCDETVRKVLGEGSRVVQSGVVSPRSVPGAALPDRHDSGIGDSEARESVQSARAYCISDATW
jgi:hypothetical protein